MGGDPPRQALPQQDFVIRHYDTHGTSAWMRVPPVRRRSTISRPDSVPTRSSRSVRSRGGCASVSCDRPPSQTEAHHLHPWRSGGRTDLANGILLCAAHHQMADDPQRWEMTQLEGGGVRFGRRRE